MYLFLKDTFRVLAVLVLYFTPLFVFGSVFCLILIVSLFYFLCGVCNYCDCFHLCCISLRVFMLLTPHAVWSFSRSGFFVCFIFFIKVYILFLLFVLYFPLLEQSSEVFWIYWGSLSNESECSSSHHLITSLCCGCFNQV